MTLFISNPEGENLLHSIDHRNIWILYVPVSNPLFWVKEQIMNKKAIHLICVFILLTSLQIASSFNDLQGILGQEADQPASQEITFQGNHASQNGADQGDSSSDDSGQENSDPSENQSSCTESFAGSTNFSEGQEFEAGDATQATITLINTGTCTWHAGYKLISDSCPGR
jgi:hypothetical protein